MPGWRSNPDLYRRQAAKNQAINNQKTAQKIANNLNQRRKQVDQPSWRADPEEAGHRRPPLPLPQMARESPEQARASEADGPDLRICPPRRHN